MSGLILSLTGSFGNSPQTSRPDSGGCWRVCPPVALGGGGQGPSLTLPLYGGTLSGTDEESLWRAPRDRSRLTAGGFLFPGTSIPGRFREQRVTVRQQIEQLLGRALTAAQAAGRLPDIDPDDLGLERSRVRDRGLFQHAANASGPRGGRRAG